MGSELSSFITPREAGMMDRVQLNKNCDFIGKQALLDIQDQPQKKRLAHITLQEYDEGNFPWGGEPIFSNGSLLGSTTSASYSFKGDRPVCLGYLEGEGEDSVVQGGWCRIEIAGIFFPVSISLH